MEVEEKIRRLIRHVYRFSRSPRDKIFNKLVLNIMWCVGRKRKIWKHFTMCWLLHNLIEVFAKQNENFMKFLWTFFLFLLPRISLWMIKDLSCVTHKNRLLLLVNQRQKFTKFYYEQCMNEATKKYLIKKSLMKL